MASVPKVMSIFYFPRPSQKTNLLVLFYFNSQISITCFGLRPGHMVSDVLLTKINGNTKRLAYKIHFLWQLHFHFLPKRSSQVFTKLAKFKNVHPSGVSSSPCPLTCSPSPPPFSWSPSLLPKEMLPQTKQQRSVWVCSYCLRPSLRGPRGTKVPSSLIFVNLAHCPIIQLTPLTKKQL